MAAVDLATLALQIENGEAVRKIEETGRKLEGLGEKGDAAAARLKSSFARTIGTADGLTKSQEELQRQLDALAEATKAADFADKAHIATLQKKADLFRQVANAIQATQAQQEQLAATTAALTAGEEAATAATVEHVAVQRTLAATSETAHLGLSRVRYAFGSLASEAIGVNPVVGRVAGVLGTMAYGTLATIGVFAGISAVIALYDKLTEAARKTADAQDKASAALARMLHLKSLGVGGETQSQVNTVQRELDGLRAQLRAFDAAAAAEARGMHGQPMVPEAARRLHENRQAILNQMTPLEAELGAGHAHIDALAQQQAQATEDRRARELADLIQHNHATKAQYDYAVQLYRTYQTELKELQQQRPWDTAGQAWVVGVMGTLHDALHPKAHHAAHQTTHGLGDAASLVPHYYHAPNPWTYAADATRMAYRAVPHDALAALQDAHRLDSILTPLRAIVSDAQTMQQRIDVQNAIRAHEGLGPINEGPGSVMGQVRARAVTAGGDVARELQALGEHGEAAKRVLAELNKLLKSIGADAAHTKAARDWLPGAMSGLRTAGDLANIMGHTTAGNLIGTGANVLGNVEAAKKAGAISLTNFIPDFQAVTSVLSFGKQLFGLGHDAHKAAVHLAEVRQQMTLTIDAQTAAVNNQPLRAAIDNLKNGLLSTLATLNQALPGKKNETMRNALMNQARTTEAAAEGIAAQDYANQSKWTAMSVQAQLDRAKGLSYQASLLDLQISQQQQIQQLVKQGQILADGSGTGAQRALYLQIQQVDAAQKMALSLQTLTSFGNAPAGHFTSSIGAYAGDYVTRQPIGPPAPPTTSTTVTGPITIHVPGGPNPDATARAVVHAIRRLGAAAIGTNASTADYMDYIE